MFYSNNVQDTRQFFFNSWQKYQLKKPLSALEQQIVEVILIHPEYHSILRTHNPSNNVKNFFSEQGEANPFLHMGLHLAVREQLTINRPAGIADIYQQLLLKYVDTMHVEHLLMEQLSECLWQAQNNQTVPDEQIYFAACKNLLSSN
ncbi:MAG: DUF1841 family protein [Legionella sp.]